MKDFVYRVCDEASIIINRKNRKSIYFEGPLAPHTVQLVENSDFVLPPDFVCQFGEDLRGVVFDDFNEIRKEVLFFMADDGAKVSSPASVNISSSSPVADFSRYAGSRWKVVTANIELTYSCNYRCAMCYLESYRDRGKSKKFIFDIVRQLKEEGVLFVLLTGGEILLRRDIVDIIDFLNSMDFIIELKTNGSFISDSLLNQIANYYFFDVQVSIYDTTDGFSEISRSTYNFSRITNNIKNMCSLGLPVTVSVLVGKHNVDNLRLIHSKISGLGASVYYSPYITPNRGHDRREVHFRLSLEEMNRKLRPFLEEIGAFPTLNQYRDCKRRSPVCYAGMDQIAISPSGIVYPCLDLRVALGDLNQEPLSDILSKREAKLNSYMFGDLEKCFSCHLKEVCDSCIGISLIENGDYRIPSRHKCDITHFYSMKGGN